MVIFQYNLYIFVWIITNTVYAMDPNSSVIKRLWCTVLEERRHCIVYEPHVISIKAYFLRKFNIRGPVVKNR